MKSIAFFLSAILISVTSLKAQKFSQADVDAMVNSKRISFQPQSMVTGGGRSKQLTDYYSLKISGDTLICNLPYFGVAYSAPINTSDAGLNFTSTNFTYSVSPKKKERYNISIQTKDKISNTNFTLTVYTNGTAYLQANNSDKQQVSYNGFLIK